VVTVLAFSAIEVIANPIRHLIDPFVLTFWRFLLGAVFLLPFALLGKTPLLYDVDRKAVLILTALGCLNVIVSMGAHAVCIKYAKASTAAILIASNPIATNLLAWLILGELLDARRMGALGIGFCGVVLITFQPSPGLDTPAGIVAGIVALLGFALYTVLSKDIVKRLGSLRVTVLSFFLALVVYFPVLLVSDVSIRPAAGLWPRLILLGVIVSGVGYWTFFKALADLPAGRASLLFFFKPPVSIILAWFILKEAPSFVALLGSGLIMLGIVLDRKVPSNHLVS